MRKVISMLFIIIFVGSIILSVGCGKKNIPPPPPPTTPDQTPVGDEVQLPEWFTNPPEDPDNLYSAATESSQDMQFALERARESGRQEIGRQIALRVTSMMKTFREEVGMDEDAEFLSLASSASKSVADECIRGSKSEKQKIIREPAKYRAYVLMKLPIGVANTALMEKIKANKNMYTRFRASQAFQELEEEAEKYQQFKAEQEQG